VNWPPGSPISLVRGSGAGTGRERGITLTHTTILRWVQRYVPEFEKPWSRYARPVGDSIEKRVYPHLFRHQIITFLTRKGIISPKLQLLSGHAEEKSLAIYRDLALADVSDEYEQAMASFPVR
jgi:site-specific recombinase XerD